MGKYSLNAVQELDMISLESISGGRGKNHAPSSGVSGGNWGAGLPNIKGGGNVTVNLSMNISVINIINSYIAGPLTITTFQGNLGAA